MLRSALACLMLFTSAALAATSNVPLGLNYSEWGPYFSSFISLGQQIASDSSGALYILSPCTLADNSPSCLTKLAANGQAILWQNNLARYAAAMAVDPDGGVYLILVPTSAATTSSGVIVEKLSADGASVLWSTTLGTGFSFPAGSVSLAVDAAGRAFVAGSLCNSVVQGACVVRLNAAGAIDATFADLYLQPSGIAVDPTGSDVVIASAAAPNYAFARLAPDNASWLQFTPPLGTITPGIAVAPNGDAVIYGSDLQGNRSLQRIDPSGAVVFSKTVPALGLGGTTSGWLPGPLALDAAGNAYITGYTGAFGIPTRNSLAPCGTTWMSVYAPDGAILQTTYLPGATGSAMSYPLIALGPGAAVFVLTEADTTFAPTETGPFPQFPFGAQSGSAAIYNLSPNTGAETLPLACVANAASYGTGAVAPGELVALYGNNLGPQQGIQTSATLESPYPTQAGGVEVTFDGKPGPLLWVQDSQVNVAVPWSVAGPTTQICVTYTNVQTNCLTWPVAQTAPGVYTVDGVHAVALNQDGTLNSASNPAPQNTIVAVWATGLGPIAPPQPDGSLVWLPLPVNVYPAVLEQPVTLGTGIACCVSLTFPAPTTYLGPAPLQIAGTSQINFNSNLFDASNSLILGGQSFRIYVAPKGGQ